MYTRVTAVAPDPNFIAFYYKTEDMFNAVSLKSTYRTRMMKDDKGESMTDDLAMSADETDAFTLFINTALHDAFNSVMKMTTGVADAILPDKTLAQILGDILVVDEGKYYAFRIKDNAAYNANNLALVDDGVKNLIEAFINKSWWEMVGVDPEFLKAKEKYREIKTDLINKRLFQLRKPLIN